MKKDGLILILAIALALVMWPGIEESMGDTAKFVVGGGLILVIMLSRFNIKPSMPKMGKQQWKPPKQQPPQQRRGQQPQQQFDRGQQRGQSNQGKQRGMPQQGRPQQQQQQFSRGQPQRQPQYQQQQRRLPPQQQYQVPYVEDYEDEEFFDE